ncbi:hypothetical protein SAY86_019820 [Trapa natans]|uniref:Histone-lysine N-methyltransferase SUVR3 n=1 Tax=Trapa natans TaxID=22666 RepID=A0AAN7LLK4_TRANT|nr:hypothetical protein SAY86_019820 [Trapa natans]
MSQFGTKKCRRRADAGGLVHLPPNSDFLSCKELVLPWLSPLELANVSGTCKVLSRACASITQRRSLDASRGLEKFSIPFVNSIDPVPYSYFHYAPSQLLHSLDRQPWGSIGGRPSLPDSPNHLYFETVSDSVTLGCSCERCDNGRSCPCLRLDGLEGMDAECGPNCKCELDCGNRLTQGGISVKLKIVRVAGKGWGLFADQPIREGQFICEYTGELIMTKEAQRRQQVYDQLARRGHFSSALLVVREHLPSGMACLRLNIDATRIGNVARFINHSCDGGNLSTVLIRSIGALLPRLCLFSSKYIGQDEELSFSYGESRPRPVSDSSLCFCGSSFCSGSLPSEHT